MNGGLDMFTKEELLVIEDALNIADEKYIKLMEESRNNKNKLVAYNRKQKKLWLVQNKLKKILLSGCFLIYIFIDKYSNNNTYGSIKSSIYSIKIRSYSRIINHYAYENNTGNCYSCRFLKQCTCMYNNNSSKCSY